MRGQYEVEVEVYRDEKPLYLQRAHLKDGMFGIDGALINAEDYFRNMAANRVVVYLSEEDDLINIFEEDDLKMKELIEKIRVSIEKLEGENDGSSRSRNLQTI